MAQEKEKENLMLHRGVMVNVDVSHEIDLMIGGTAKRKLGCRSSFISVCFVLSPLGVSSYVEEKIWEHIACFMNPRLGGNRHTKTGPPML